MRGITPHLWFDTEAVEAAEFYCSVLPASKVTSMTTLPGTPSGDAEVVWFELWGQRFQAISAGPLFAFNPSISFLVGCDTVEEVDRLWGRLSEGGTALMPLDRYPFSDRYGWTEDRYGLSWQVMLAGVPPPQRVTPMLLFVGDVCGRAEEAITHYTSLFPNSAIGDIHRYGPDEDPDVEGTVKHGAFVVGGHHLAAMDSAHDHAFGFSEAVSLLVGCDGQEEIDRYWEGLSAVPEAEQCGWLKDRYGVSWQVVPADLDEMLRTGTREQIARVVEAVLPMRKLDVAALQRAYEGG